ncbi:recombinase family protein, partial [Actinomadura sp. 7K507]|uniref:recombinase family protein n=1 Tax=Actinomadura sp. 7K507 TaxID=2530365 RepID=UPI00104BF9BC
MDATATNGQVREVTDEEVRSAQVRRAMADAAPMEINGIAGRWTDTGLEWKATDPEAETDTLALVRISDADDGDVNGVARQVAKACAYAARNGYRLGLILVENDTSAFKRRKITLPNGDRQLRTVRPQFRKALRELDRGRFPQFLAVHLDRAVRDPRDLEDLIDVVEQSRPRIVCDSVEGSLRLACDADITMARVLCAIANQSSRDTARRVSDARREQAQEGRHGGGARRYGFEPDGVTVRESEAAWIRDAADQMLGNVAVREVTRDLTARGWRRPDGKRWTSVGVRDLLLRPRNAGLSVHRKGVRGRAYYTPDDVVGSLPGDPIIEPDRFWSLVTKLTDPDRRTNTAGTAPKWFGSGIYRCPCGQTLRVQIKRYTHTDRRTKERTTVEREVYRCREIDAGHVTCTRAELDALTVATLHEWISTADPADIIGKRTTAEDVAKLRAEVTRHKDRLEEIAADYDEDRITREQMLKSTDKRRRKLNQAQERLAAVADEEDPAARLVGADDIAAAWQDLTLGEQRQILARLLTVTVQPIGRGKRTPVHERVTITKRKRPTPPAPTAQAA